MIDEFQFQFETADFLFPAFLFSTVRKFAGERHFSCRISTLLIWMTQKMCLAILPQAEGCHFTRSLPTLFTTLKLQSQSHNVPELHKIRRSPDLEALKF